jgi:hypothetical protein
VTAVRSVAAVRSARPPNQPLSSGVAGYGFSMQLSLLLIVIGIVLAILVHYALGIAVILIGLVLLIWPRIAGGGAARV